MSSTPDRTPILRAEGLEKTYRMGSAKIEVLRGVGLEVYPGEILAIAGPSGAGKSTLLHLLGLLEDPDAGRVFLDGVDTSTLSRKQQALIRTERIGIVFQFYHLLADLDALENTLLPRMVRDSWWRYDKKEARARATQLLERVGLGQRLHHRPSQLSGGERQRVAIARALMNEPQVLLCDEPTGNLDMETARGILDLIWELNRELDTAFVVVTHDERLARRADRAVRVANGLVIQQSDVDA